MVDTSSGLRIMLVSQSMYPLLRGIPVVVEVLLSEKISASLVCCILMLVYSSKYVLVS